tara:strand:+ start:77 stop:343 length:267 start_codon:yes stop_codon:yes gene_type:complete
MEFVKVLRNDDQYKQALFKFGNEYLKYSYVFHQESVGHLQVPIDETMVFHTDQDGADITGESLYEASGYVSTAVVMPAVAARLIERRR